MSPISEEHSRISILFFPRQLARLIRSLLEYDFWISPVISSEGRCDLWMGVQVPVMWHLASYSSMSAEIPARPVDSDNNAATLLARSDRLTSSPCPGPFWNGHGLPPHFRKDAVLRELPLNLTELLGRGIQAGH